ncbi:essential MCU regulator, mitochondrial [Apis mellifera caucasica]|uniref:Essential MCU regulator, mitochondrial n=1 Tax=Apis mellifera TaxID=7460 RepID=A0A7M7H3W3_APIME|nr:essential MCU regulator, mitochondrial [Apis mellifera]XP_026296436.1 essential MCU regulator, mitochondrial [Apis mellifera]KAG6804150.1 essential MCU regulator, mitochondrial [Apis mellifera caucasica]KAG9433692.1 essential MCU regulator, mitochondrial [Apis mellifera carnica]|eukprot:XP_006570318.1 essential MCU regulator, mitochondrial [Apis mellifera]
MALQRSTVAFQSIHNLRKIDGEIKLHLRSRTTTPSGAILPEPKRTRFGILSVICSVTLGLIIGTTISKRMANFLEEKELFIPSDDDDDDD